MSAPVTRKLQALADLGVGTQGVVWALGQEGEAGLWLRALGLFEGQRVMVLRRAPFGGPFHVRVGDAARGSGRSCAEFAIDPSLAAQITMEPRASGAP